ncbi:hypothetical protein ABH973_006692 [Bradyrhizobium ottawaense]|uniref:hypothetical protein n=1 Tax=Bradyrhizobium ottawaense TaxID=931866 RepID=UPI00351227DE
MAFVPPRDRVLEQSTSNSQSVFTVTGAVDAGYNAFSASMGVGDTTFGAVVEPGVAFKAGLLTYSATNEVTVTTAFETKGTFSSGGVKQVFMGMPAAGAVVSQVFGQCKLVKSGSNLVLLPFGGDQLSIDGRPRGIPSGGVSLAPTGLTPGTNYFIYAAMSGATMILEAATTIHATNNAPGANGLEVKNNDGTRTLVGFARVVTGPAWADTATQRLVRSWFNCDAVDLTGATDSSTTNATGTMTEATVSTCEFLCWSFEVVEAYTVGTITNTVNSGNVASQIYIDGAAVGLQNPINPVSVSGRTSVNNRYSAKLAEGYHTVRFGISAPGSGTASASYGMQAQARVG